ncbi:MAG: hypothetical protein COY68_02465 [Candidatus Levybacteria bacterium CG_4_10_14_0_8_um_filter_35_23]|nr:MAG: hypothetical protein COY68_02465 [Candidatus Levybacteria bacterium CG_4_10_14_0_8_um_filter_35_23]
MNKKHLLFITILTFALAIFSYKASFALFASQASSNNNTFTASNVFPTATPSASPTPTPTPIAQSLVVNEFAANPGTTFTTEWVEIYNPGSSDVNLSGWSLADSANPSKDISSLGTINAGGFVTYENSEGWLNNDGDTVTLKDSTSNIIDSHAYTGNIADDESIGRSSDAGSTWKKCTIQTKNSGNNGNC